jgi:prepilin-type N-terminal cleavage/methylation domain-containing protein
MSKGFTLIETIIYIALLGVFLSGAVLVAYGLIGSSGRVEGRNTVQEEGNFVLGKMRYALGSASGISVPTAQTLIVTRHGGPAAHITLNGSAVEMSDDGGVTFAPLTTVNVTVTALAFKKIPATLGAPEGVMATTTIDGTDFVLTAYIRN